jgi:hypothetical protein
MPFPAEQSITPDTRGQVNIFFHIPDPSNPNDQQSGSITVQIYYSDATSRDRVFDLLVRLQDDAPGLAHLSNLASLRTYILGRIDSEILPP